MPDEKQLTPFEMAKINITKTAENFNFYNSIEMLVAAISGLEKVSDHEREVLEKMFANVMEELSSFIEERDKQWN